MLKALFGSKDKELVLQYLLSKQEGKMDIDLIVQSINKHNEIKIKM